VQHRPTPSAQRLAKAPAKHSDSIMAADATRAKPGVKVAANGYVTSNAYVERSAADPFLIARARDPASQGGPEPPQAKHVAGRAGSSKGRTPTGPASAQEACNGRGFFARAVCMDRECEQPLFRDSADCSRILAMKRTREGH
jgi:non-specific serine/threonine protein kinase